jgi:hypothetical protein
MPSAFGDDSDLCRMLRLVAPQFEHRLFLSATPHNGHTRCFTGLLEILDPVRFSQTSELKPAEKERIQQVVLRRLKREINARTNPPKFCTRHAPHAVTLALSPAEVALSDAFDAFRTGIRKLIASGEGKRRRAGTFAVEILGKRLLSCPTAFAESWRRAKEGLAAIEAATEGEVDSARRSFERETADDKEAQSREATATGVVGAWLKHVAADLQQEIAGIDTALAGLGFDLTADVIVSQTPAADARYDALVALIEDRLRHDGEWRDDERLLVFTEYKTTLDYLVRRLRSDYESDRLLMLYGSGGSEGMDEDVRDAVKNAFNEPSHSVRVLIATDAAAEGLNLQRTARYLLHFDCPWNPSRLEQRNGRIDRHGQARDVTVHHFMTDQVQDLRFLAHVIAKADEIREDLGSANELFDEAAHRRLVDGESVAAVQADLDRGITAARGRASYEADSTVETATMGTVASQELNALAAEIDLDHQSLRDTLEAAMAIRHGRPQLECSPEQQTCKVLNPSLPGWSEVIDDSLRRGSTRDVRGPVARIAFKVEPFLEEIAGRLVFAPRPDVMLMHLSHPMMQRAMSSLTRRRFPGTGDEVSRWTVRLGDVPAGADAVVMLSVEELAVNDLRETFHHWVRTLTFPIAAGDLGEVLAHQPALSLRGATATREDSQHAQAANLCDDVVPQLKAFLSKHAERLTVALRAQLREAGTDARKLEEERYRSRQAEVSSLITEQTMAKLTREIAELTVEQSQGFLFDPEGQFAAIRRTVEEKQAELARRESHHREVREQLERERERILKHVLPKRHGMASSAQVFPVTIEVRLRRPGAAV